MALLSLSVLAGALARAQVGELLIAAIRGRMHLILDQNQPWSDRTAGELFSQFNFDYEDQYSSDLALPAFVKDSRDLFDRLGGDKKNICIIVSDGRMNKALVRPQIAEAELKDYLYLFIILDKDNPNDSILNYKTTHIETENGQTRVSIQDYLGDFPFRYYLIIKASLSGYIASRGSPLAHVERLF